MAVAAERGWLASAHSKREEASKPIRLRGLNNAAAEEPQRDWSHLPLQQSGVADVLSPGATELVWWHEGASLVLNCSCSFKTPEPKDIEQPKTTLDWSNQMVIITAKNDLLSKGFISAIKQYFCKSNGADLQGQQC